MSPLAGYLLETLVTLAAVVVLAVLVLYSARRVGIGRPTGPLELVGRLPLDNRRAVYLVRVEGTVYVLGASETGLVKLGELGASSEQLSAALPAPKFRDVLRGARRRGAPEPASPGVGEDGDDSS